MSKLKLTLVETEKKRRAPSGKKADQARVILRGSDWMAKVERHNSVSGITRLDQTARNFSQSKLKWKGF
ncbi:MAG TPA: hypothetical protein VNU74_05700 [Terriglobales bacterium]|jgi:hypothetical protein|nr:hypothetical protein [Terriglobales bacterium]